MGNSVVTFKGVEKKYAGKRAVKDLCLDIIKGEFFGIIGPNGAGKTTTISMLSGLLKPSKGTICINGTDLSNSPTSIKSKLGMVPQEFAFYPTLSSKDNLAFFGSIYGLRGKYLRKRISEVLRVVELEPFAGRIVSKFSNGMKRRLNIAIGLLHEPEILILDEPTVGIDVHSRNAIYESLKLLNRSGITILYTTHYLEEAERLCNRVAIMDRGEIMAISTVSELVRESGEGIIFIELKQPADENHLQRFMEIGKVKVVNSHGKQLHLKTANANKAVKEIIDLTEREALQLKTLNILEPNLENVFLHLTGRNIRD